MEAKGAHRAARVGATAAARVGATADNSRASDVPASWALLHALGAGTFGTVTAYRIEEHDYAVKKVEQVFATSVSALRILREAQILAHFNHPNIVSLRSIYVDGGNFEDVYLCMEIVDTTLAAFTHPSSNVLGESEVLSACYQMFRGLVCLSGARVIHRDIKPSNVLVGKSGQVKLADFGLARSVDAFDEQQLLGDREGQLTQYVVTRSYRAPEVLLTPGRYSFPLDIWAAGCTIGEVLAKRVLFQSNNSLDHVRRVIMVVGTPEAVDLDWIPADSSARGFVRSVSAEAGSYPNLLNDLLRTGNDDLRGLLVASMRFNPARRPSAVEAVGNAAFANCRVDRDPLVASALAAGVFESTWEDRLKLARGRPSAAMLRRLRDAIISTAAELQHAISESRGGPPPELPSRAAHGPEPGVVVGDGRCRERLGMPSRASARDGAAQALVPYCGPGAAVDFGTAARYASGMMISVAGAKSRDGSRHNTDPLQRAAVTTTRRASEHGRQPEERRCAGSCSGYVGGGRDLGRGPRCLPVYRNPPPLDVHNFL